MESTEEPETTEDSTGCYDTDDPAEQVEEERLREFLRLIRSCSVSAVKELLDGYDGFDINRKNYRGVTGLSLAVEVNCEPIVDLLLARPGLEIGDTLMHAICTNRDAIAEKLLDVMQTRHPERVMSGCVSAEFPEHLTPLMLAAQCGNFKMISLLLSRGHKIPIPHKPKCLCKEVNTYRGGNWPCLARLRGQLAASRT